MSMASWIPYMVGRLPDSAVRHRGPLAWARASTTASRSFGGGLLLGLDTFVSQSLRPQRFERRALSLVNGVFLAVALTPILMLIALCWPPLMQHFGISAELVGNRWRPFLRALNWGTLRCWPTSPFAAICRQ